MICGSTRGGRVPKNWRRCPMQAQGSPVTTKMVEKHPRSAAAKNLPRPRAEKPRIGCQYLLLNRHENIKAASALLYFDHR